MHTGTQTQPERYRPNGGVGNEYDKWTNDGLVETYWGEHIHLGAYTTDEAKGWFHRDDGFIEALVKCTCWNQRARTTMFKEQKFTFVDDLLSWGGFDAVVKGMTDKDSTLRILDVGCGIGGSSRIMAKRYGEAVTGITLSDAQVERASELSREAGLNNVTFKKMDALRMEFPDASYDLIWSCECGEHVPDKAKYIEEMCRVLKPGGRLIVATWCEKDDRKSLTDHQKWLLRFLYEEWSHPMFISIEKYEDILRKNSLSMEGVESADWTPQTLPSWRHSIFVGVWWPWPVIIRGPRVWWSTIREIVTIERMHEAFRDGVMRYGVFRATK
ncbi:3-demethylubiquinone-9 3-methyltransferase, putative [Perkinsus marinus ATCC 50983]|uniref:3-demethylubiquinone-9 3-methyltransferase, putative n=1 Tax=Perkinsus marinus (strain ATCC 50983 / TXsc) TaxID=423536 RepID=C5L0G8_PERM5|nr:3-demethylubiquinone-9 3-methyltransferase, putative [Perkinsus marinus ATCC 50983]EER09791.1 3-demethylubiquinone-9 3-methyltransferase, putative [Perkinsus marinus ATCC 50983]|eukprot:XP_002777996.1 3-demethylubiquinone-9 3-methyltransferase, putative [Perkinsus marinus ATCC 50983]